jgi:alpha-beta hydrolase superfamily lysophospholipase
LHKAHAIVCMQGPGKPQVYAGSWVERLNQAAISVAGHDMQGNGFSQGLRGRRGYFDSLDDVIADAIQFRRWCCFGKHSATYFKPLTLYALW